VPLGLRQEIADLILLSAHDKWLREFQPVDAVQAALRQVTYPLIRMALGRLRARLELSDDSFLAGPQFPSLELPALQQIIQRRNELAVMFDLERLAVGQYAVHDLPSIMRAGAERAIVERMI